MKFTWLSSESSLIAAYIFEGIFGPLKCNIRYMLYQIQQNKHDETEYQITSSESVLCFIFNWVYTLHILNRKLICTSQTARSIFSILYNVPVFTFRSSSTLYNAQQKGLFNIINHEIQLQIETHDKCL